MQHGTAVVHVTAQSWQFSFYIHPDEAETRTKTTVQKRINQAGCGFIDLTGEYHAGYAPGEDCPSRASSAWRAQ